MRLLSKICFKQKFLQNICLLKSLLISNFKNHEKIRIKSDGKSEG